MKILAPIRSKAFSAAATGASLAVAQAATIQESGGGKSLTIDSKAVVSRNTKTAVPPVKTTPRVHRIALEEEAEWSDAAQVKFRELARAHALGNMTEKQAVEFERFKELRRRATPSRTFEQIHADIELHSAVNAAIAGLQQLIDHGTRVFRTEA
jgi:hypothetical protein